MGYKTSGPIVSFIALVPGSRSNVSINCGFRATLMLNIDRKK